VGVPKAASGAALGFMHENTERSEQIEYKKHTRVTPVYVSDLYRYTLFIDKY